MLEAADREHETDTLWDTVGARGRWNSARVVQQEWSTIMTARKIQKQQKQRKAVRAANVTASSTRSLAVGSQLLRWVNPSSTFVRHQLCCA